jgi:ubiquinone biosynthesis protein
LKPFNYLANAVRAPEIVAILVRWGFEDLLLQLETPPFLLRNLIRSKVAHLTPHERLRNALEELGPIFVKFGQLLCTRPDRLPEPLLRELKKLRDQVEPQAFDRIENVLQKELKAEIDEIFEEFNPVPVAAGSLGQVYKARRGSDQVWVAVKVQRADIQTSIRADMDIIGWFARQLHARVKDLKPYNLPNLVRDAEERLHHELNYRNEADNAKIFQSLNSSESRVFAPEVDRNLSTARLLVTEWVAGSSPETVELDEESASELAILGGQSMFQQIVCTGFFHADPHAGNLLITEDKKLCLLDWGQAGQISLEKRYVLADLFAAITEFDPEAVTRVAERMSEGGRPINRVRLEKEVTYLLNRYRHVESKNRDMGSIGLELIYLFGRNGVLVSSDYALLSKAILCVEETARTLDPEFDLEIVARPFLLDLAKSRWSLPSLKRQALYPALSAARHLRQVPEQLQRILQRVEEEDIQINMHHAGTEDLEETFNASMNRLTAGIIVGSLLIGSSLVITTGVKPLVWGYPFLGLLGFLASVLLGIYIVFSTFRNHR